MASDHAVPVTGPLPQVGRVDATSGTPQANPDGSYDPRVVDAAFLANAGDKPWLLFVHGTFSTGATFTDLHPDFAKWHTDYDGHVLVFDHPTVATTPEANAQWLLSQLPTGRVLDIDVVSHSRGGLVARQLVAQRGSRCLNIRRLVQVASPNAGTVLASSSRLGDLLDTFTNLFALVPDGTGGVVALLAVLEVVKQVAVGALSGLTGLASMDPSCASLARLNAMNWTTPSVHAITSDYQPEAGASLARNTLNAIVDALFAEAGNDLVVPTLGMATAGTFVVDTPFVATSPTVTHSGYFSDTAVQAEIRRCLALPVAAPLRCM
jgi:pimeloyl-ACP methyl ester carboxylesterase